jgi:Spy/CpxP family protein refolding chaperone
VSARILLVMLFAAPALVTVQGGGGGGQSGAPQQNPDPTPFEQYVDKLTLRTEQLAPIQKIFTAASAEAAPFSRELLALRETMLTAESAGNADQFAAAAASYTTAAAKMAAVEVKAFAQAESVLMPKQLSKTAEAFVVIAGVFNQPTPRLNLMPARRGGGGGSAGGVLLAAAPLVAQRGGGGGGGGFGGPPPPTTRLGMMAMALTFSDDQKKQVKNLLDAEYKNTAPLRDALAKSRLALGMAVQNKMAGAELDAATKAYADQASAMAQAEMRALAKVMKLLTEEQRANQTVMRWALNMSRGMLADKKWDTSPDHRFY